MTPLTNIEVDKLKEEYFSLVEKFTPKKVKESPIINLNNPKEIKLVITKELIEKWNLEDWLANYRKEAQVSTGGIRGPQNILYCWDVRFPINQVGVALATLAKAMILKEKIKNKDIHKIVAGEVRYNTDFYIELISRIQAAQGIYCHLPFDTTAVWIVSFLIFMLDYDGGEYVTSSHAVSSKTATKDLNNEGSQFLPEESLAFVDKIEEIINKAKSSPEGYEIKLSPKIHPLITKDFNGFDLYINYLRKGVATEANLNLIREAIKKGFKLMFEVVGGCMYKPMLPILQRLEIAEVFEWNNIEEDPFFHGIGKIRRWDPETKKMEFFDLSCDVCLPEVVDTMGYETLLKDKPMGYIVLITDPDGDRLVIGQVEPSDRTEKLEDLGVYYIKIKEGKVFTVYHPTYSFLMTMDFHMKRLKEAGLWNNYPRFIIKTTPSSEAWEEWAKNNSIKVVNTPVGFKEIATIMRKVEKQLKEKPGEEVIIKDIYGNSINLGVQPRLHFGGEESGGMITGHEELIVSKKGRIAIAMREKSAGEASIITSAIAAQLFSKKQFLSDYLEGIFNENKIKCKYYVRQDIIYYNESEADPKKLMKDKLAGEKLRDTTDLFYLGLALATRENKIGIEQGRKILSEIFPELDFTNLIDIIFVGDATFLKFKDMFVEIRRSGTDAKMRGYACGIDKKKCELFLDKLLNYSGEITPLYDKLIPTSFRKSIYELAIKIYRKYLYEGL